MELFPNPKTFISIFGIDIAWYAVIIMFGAAVGLYLTTQAAKKSNISSEQVEDVFFGTLIFGLIGARLWYVIFYPDISYFLEDLTRVLAFRDGGLAIQGGLVAGAIYAYYKTAKLGISFLDLADSAMPGVMIAQAIGRWGNFVNQEAYGEVVSAAYFKYFPNWFKDYMFINGEYRQPMFFWESILNILGFILIKFALPKFRKMKQGDYVYAYLIWYGIVRIGIEHFRTDSLMFMGLKSAQLVSLVFIIVGVIGFMGVFRKKQDKQDTLILFDFDGTLGDTNPLILSTFTKVFNEVDPSITLSEDTKLSFIGPTLYHSFERHLEAHHDIDACVVRYKELNMNMQRESLEEIKDSKKLLETLSAKNYVLGVVSSKTRDSLTLGLDLLNFTENLSIIIGGNEVGHPKPNPEGILKAKQEVLANAKKCYYVGDTVTDVEAARAAGFISIAIVTTKQFEEKIKASNPDYIIYDLMDVAKIIEENENE